MLAIAKYNKSNPSGGFSLVEVAIALAIMGFACVTLIGMIPMGLTSFHQAMGNTVESEIVQNLSNDMLLANFSDLYQYSYANSTTTTHQTYYYNNEGSPATGTGTPPSDAVYTVVVTLVPLTSTTSTSTSNSPTGLTANGISTATTANTSAYNVIITIASNPSVASYTSGTGSASMAAFLSAYATGTATGVTHAPDQYCFVIANNNL